MKTLHSIKKICYYFFVFFIIFSFIIFPAFFPLFSIFIYFFINILYFITNIIKILLFSLSIKNTNIKKYYEKDYLKIPESDLPIYSIILPVKNEKEFVLRNLLNSIFNLEYQHSKLDIKLIVDDDDLETLKIAEKLLKDYKFDFIIVPTGPVKSKPMSCNFALKFVKGKYLTIYDAEDIPEKYQLVKAINAFNTLDEKYVCIQASLNFYNKYENYITYYFSIEYSMWFDFTIKSLTKFANFFPLGGTSNHFKVKELKELGGWDGYNVTEDAELGIRIVKAGYKVGLLNSITEEEAPITLPSWLRQRTRWIKGFMQTFCEHTILKKPIGINSKIKFKTLLDLNIFDFIVYIVFIMMSFFFFISIIAIFINHVLILKLRSFEYLTFIVNFNLIILLIINYGSFIIICIKNKMKFNLIYFVLFPFYWTLHYIAAIRAFYFLIKNPFHWEKTEHGLSKINKKS